MSIGHAPDEAETVLLLIDVINPIDFESGEKLLAHALPMARSLAAFKRQTKAAGVPVIYVNDNFRRWRSDCRKLVEHCLNAHVPANRSLRSYGSGDKFTRPRSTGCK